MIQWVEEPMRIEGMGIKPHDRLILDPDDPQIAFHLKREPELADRLERIGALGESHEITASSRDLENRQVSVRIKIANDGTDVWLAFHMEASLSIIRCIKHVPSSKAPFTYDY